MATTFTSIPQVAEALLNANFVAALESGNDLSRAEASTLASQVQNYAQQFGVNPFTITAEMARQGVDAGNLRLIESYL